MRATLIVCAVMGILASTASADEFKCLGKAVFVKMENGKESKRGEVWMDGTFGITWDGGATALFRDGKFKRQIPITVSNNKLVTADDYYGTDTQQIITKLKLEYTPDLTMAEADIYSEAKRGGTVWIRHMIGHCCPDCAS